MTVFVTQAELAAATSGGWPIGSVFLSVVATNPATLLGFGTWSAFGAGRMLVGLDSGDGDFDTAEETGGAKTHSHAVGTIAPNAHSGTAVGAHASHTHTYSQVPDHVHVQRCQGGTTASTTGTHIMTSTATGGSIRSSGQSTLNPTSASNPGTTDGPSASLTHSVTQPSDHTMSGSTATASGLPPYIVVYMWKRTA
jgi:hypothetical protein